MGPAFADPETRGIVLGLWMVGVESFAPATGNIVTITQHEALWITGRERYRAAMQVVARVCEKVGYRVWFHPRGTPVPHWSDLAQTLVRPCTDPGETLVRPSRDSPETLVRVPKGTVAMSVHIRKLSEKQHLHYAGRVVTPHTPPPPKSEDRSPKSEDRIVSRQEPATPPWATDLAKLLREQVRRTKGAQVPRQLTGWAQEIARIQNTSPEEIAETIEWLWGAENQGEYALVVQSGRALREKYGRIRAAMQRRRDEQQRPRQGLIGAVERRLQAIQGERGT